MHRILVIVWALLFALSCAPLVVGDNVVVSDSRTYEGDITALSVASGFDVVLDSSVASGVVDIRTSQNILEYVEIYVEGEMLNIGLKRGNSYSVDTLEARVSPIGIVAYAVSSGSEIESVESLDVAEDLAISVSGGSDVELKGRCIGLAVSVSGGSDVDLDELQAEVVSAAVSGGSELSVYVLRGCEIAASGGSEVEYRGDPIVTEFSATGGSSIERM